MDERQLENLLKHAGKKPLQKLLKKGLSLVLKLLAPYLPVILIILAIFIMAALLVGAVYSSMPSAGTLAGIHHSSQDAEICAEAAIQVDRWNTADIYIVAGEGSWYPDTNGKKTAGFADRFGKDAELANKWGDIYAPVLYKVMMKNEDVSQRFPVEEFEKIAEDLRPYFYLKESTVTVTVQTEEGGSETSTYEVYLLVEANTIRGHYRYQYDWVTETSGSTTKTYEKLKNTATVAKWERLDEYLAAYLEIPGGKDTALARSLVFNAGEGFSARKDWLNWLTNSFGSVAWASGAMIPAELRPFFDGAAREYGIPAWFLAAVAMKESSFRVTVDGFDGTGSHGLMQVLPENWSRYAPRLGFDPAADYDNPRAQILVGAYMLSSYGITVNWDGDSWKEESLPMMVAYNAGPGRVGNAAVTEKVRENYAVIVWGYADQFKGTKVGWPVQGGVITSYFAPEGRVDLVEGILKAHNGIDLGVPQGTPVVSVSGGIAYTADNPGGYGWYVVVKDAVHEYYYGHLSRIDVNSGQTIAAGQPIGLSGGTPGTPGAGSSTGPHLHFGVKLLDGQWVDPLTVLD